MLRVPQWSRVDVALDAMRGVAKRPLGMCVADLVLQRYGVHTVSNADGNPEFPGQSDLEAVLGLRHALGAINCSLLQVRYPARFRRVSRGIAPVHIVRAPIALRPLHMLIRMVVAPPGGRLASELPETTMSRIGVRFEYPFLSLYHRNPSSKLIVTLDVANRRHWSLENDEMYAKLATSFLYPEWIMRNWDLIGEPVCREHLGRATMDARLRCSVDRGQPLPGGVYRADELMVRFDLGTGIMVRRTALLRGEIVENSRLVGIRSISWS